MSWNTCRTSLEARGQTEVFGGQDRSLQADRPIGSNVNDSNVGARVAFPNGLNEVVEGCRAPIGSNFKFGGDPPKTRIFHVDNNTPSGGNVAGVVVESRPCPKQGNLAVCMRHPLRDANKLAASLEANGVLLVRVG